MADEQAVDPYADRVENGHRPLTDEGNALRLGDDWGHSLRHIWLRKAWAVCKNERWAVHDSDIPAIECMRWTSWQIHDEAAQETDPVVQPLVQAHAVRCGSIGKMQAAVQLARADVRLQANTADFDGKPNLIASHDQVIELGRDPNGPVSSRKLHRDDMITYSTRAEFKPAVLDSPPELVANYLDTFLPDEKRRELLFRVLGSALIGGNPDRLFVVVKGVTTTGKSQLVEAIEQALGDYAATAPPSIFRGNFDDRARPDLLDVLWRRVLFLSEASQAWELHGDRIKDLVGGGIIRARGMRSNEYVAVRPQFMPILVTNELPRVVGVDQATRRRLLVINFNQRFAGGLAAEDPTIKQRFVHDPDVHEWLLARLVKGYADSVRYGLSEAVQEFALDSASAFEDLSNIGTFMQWCDDMGHLTVLGSDDDDYGNYVRDVPMRDFYDHYRFWCTNYADDRDRRERLSYKNFNAEIGEVYGWEKVKSGSWRWAHRRLNTTADIGVPTDWIP